MLTRDEFKCYAAGVYYTQNKTQATIKIEDADKFIDGAIMAYDKLSRKPSLEQQIIEKIKTIPENNYSVTPPQSRL
jgi:hypothetical protein